MDEEVGVSTFQPIKHPGNVSESDATDDDIRPMLRKPEKRGWRGRFTKIRKRQNVEKTAAKSLALQEDSSVSSWSVGSLESSILTPYSSVKPKAENDIPEEMKAFGEDFGLAAAEFALCLEEEAKGNDNKAMSQEGSNSLCDELDMAIETEDWTALEAQTSKLFHRKKDKLEDIHRKRRSSFSSHEDSDDSIREGWSTTSKSMKSGYLDPIDDERIAMLKGLIEADDWHGIDSNFSTGNYDDQSVGSSLPDAL